MSSTVLPGKDLFITLINLNILQPSIFLFIESLRMTAVGFSCAGGFFSFLAFD